MIISEKQIIQLMEHVRCIAFNEKEDGDIRTNAASLIAEINKQQSEEPKAIND